MGVAEGRVLGYKLGETEGIIEGLVVMNLDDTSVTVDIAFDHPCW